MSKTRKLYTTQLQLTFKNYLFVSEKNQIIFISLYIINLTVIITMNIAYLVLCIIYFQIYDYLINKTKGKFLSYFTKQIGFRLCCFIEIYFQHILQVIFRFWRHDPR